MPGRGRPPAGRPPVRPGPPSRAAGGRGGRSPRRSAGRRGRRPMPWVGANGLLPGRGAPGRGRRGPGRCRRGRRAAAASAAAAGPSSAPARRLLARASAEGRARVPRRGLLGGRRRGASQPERAAAAGAGAGASAAGAGLGSRRGAAAGRQAGGFGAGAFFAAGLRPSPRRQLVAVLLLEPHLDGGLDRRRCRLDELAHLLELLENNLALDSELFGELVDSGLSHASPSGPSASGVRSRTVSWCACSSGSTHRVLMSCCSNLLVGLPAVLRAVLTPGPAACRTYSSSRVGAQARPQEPGGPW